MRSNTALATRLNSAPAMRSNELAFLQHALSTTALTSVNRVKWFKEPSLKRNRKLYFKKLPTQNSLNTATNINSKGTWFLFISSIFSAFVLVFPRSAVLKAERRNRRRRRCGTTVQWCQIRAALHRTTDSGGIRTQKASDVRVSTVFRVPSYSRRVQTYYLLFYSLTPCDWQPESLRIFESHFIIRV